MRGAALGSAVASVALHSTINSEHADSCLQCPRIDVLTIAEEESMHECCRRMRAKLDCTQSWHIKEEDFMRSFYISCTCWRKMAVEDIPKVYDDAGSLATPMQLIRCCF
jgi:hypothetical protein